MARNHGSRRDGSSFDEATKLLVWQKGRVIPGVDPGVRRLDLCGKVMDWSYYGTTVRGGTGWEIDHVLPVSRGGGDELSNLQPLQWENNRSKSDDWPTWSCST